MRLLDNWADDPWIGMFTVRNLAERFSPRGGTRRQRVVISRDRRNGFDNGPLPHVRVSR